ncbi:MAG: hypothetical protein ACPL7G_10345 [Chloroflexia bacterium]
MTTSIHRLLERLQALLEESRAEAYYVGGCVRDLLLGRPLHDLDLVVAGEALALARAAACALRGAFVLLDEENGIARVVLRGAEGRPETTVDFARMRGTLAEDLARRDLTINAMAMAPDDFRRYALGETAQAALIDPWGGRRDLEKGLLRAPSRQVLYDDPLRTMRVVRLAGELDFQIEPQTADWVREVAGRLPLVSWERIRDELFRLLACPHAAPYLPLLDALALLPQVLPEVTGQDGSALERAWERVCALEWLAGLLLGRPRPEREGRFWKPQALQARPDTSWATPYAAPLRRYLEGRLSGERSRLSLLKLAALLYRGYEAEEEEEGKARRAGRRLRLSAREIRALEAAVSLPDHPLLTAAGEPLRREVYRFYRDGGDIATGALLLALARELADPAFRPARWEQTVRRLHHILTLRFERASEVIEPPRLLDGEELMAALGLPPGPLVGTLLEEIREAQAAGEVHTQDEALAWARQTLPRIVGPGLQG